MSADLFASDDREIAVLPVHMVAAETALVDLEDHEIALIRSALRLVSFGMNRSAARIVESCLQIELHLLSAKQRNALIRIAHRYRRQLPSEIAALARRGMIFGAV